MGQLQIDDCRLQIENRGLSRAVGSAIFNQQSKFNNQQ